MNNNSIINSIKKQQIHKKTTKEKTTKEKPLIKNYGKTENRKFVFIIASRNNCKNYFMNITSICNQIYSNWRCIYIDDVSTDGTYELVIDLVRKLNKEEKFTIIKNKKRRYSNYNKFWAFKACDDNEIIIILDGDDWLIDSYVLSDLNNFYSRGKEKILATYGKSIRYINGSLNKVLRNYTVYPEDIIKCRKIRTSEWFDGPMRTGYAKLFKSLPIKYYQTDDGRWFRYLCDRIEMHGIMERAGTKFSINPRAFYVVNVDNSLSTNDSHHVVPKDPLILEAIKYHKRRNPLPKIEFIPSEFAFSNIYYSFHLTKEKKNIIMNYYSKPKDPVKILVDFTVEKGYISCSEPIPIEFIDNLILIIKNPLEVLIESNPNYININTSKKAFETYFDLIHIFHCFTGKKELFFYEDIMTSLNSSTTNDRNTFKQDFIDFFDNETITSEVDSVMNNMRDIYDENKGNENSYNNRNTQGNISHNEYKRELNDYLAIKLRDERFRFIAEHYGIELYD